MPIFSNLKVIEMASVLAGPSAGQFFAELGAEVIKIENIRSHGDVTRSWTLKEEDTKHGISAYFSSVNWGKKSIALDITKPGGLKILYDLVEKAGVLIASYKPGDAEKLRVDYQSLAKVNPGVIYGHITGYGQNNPKVGYDAIIQAEAGFIDMNGEPGGNSLKMPVALMDILAAHHLKEGILLAMIRKATTGKGSYVPVSLIQAAIASLANQATNWLVAGVIPRKMGTEHPNIAPYGNIFKTADEKRIILAVGNDKQFTSLCAVLNLEGWAEDVRFKNNAGRVKHRKVLHAALKEKIARWQSRSLLQALDKVKVPAGSLNNIKEVFETPEARDLLLQHGNSKGVRSFAADCNDPREHIRLSPPPKLGQHTREVLSGWLEMRAGAMDALRRDGLIR